MSRMRKAVVLAAMTATALAAPSGVLASSHREAPGITKTPKVDNTDLYMFRSYEPGREDFVTIIANFQPDQSPNSGPNYFTLDQNANYDINIDNDGDGVPDLTYRFRFNNWITAGSGPIALPVGGKNVPIALRAIGPINSSKDMNQNDTEKYTVVQISGSAADGSARLTNVDGSGVVFAKPIDNIGHKTVPQYAQYANGFIHSVNIPGCGVAGRIFVGQRAEAFAINLGEVFDLVNFVPIEGDSKPFAKDGKGFPGGITQSRDNDDLVGKKNVTSIALELPISCITGKGNGVIGGWSTVSLPKNSVRDANPKYDATTTDTGELVQVSRLANPLVNELVIGLAKKDLFNASAPSADAQFADFVTNPTFPAILNVLFRDAVNSTLGTNIKDLAPSNFPRNDLVATFLTGIKTLNQQRTVTASEMMRLNTGIAPTARANQSTFGVVGDDLAGYPNGRRPGDDAADITLRVAMGRLCYPVPINGVRTNLGLCRKKDAPVGNVAFTDGAPISARDLQETFPYLNTPIPGSPHEARDAAAAEPAKP